MAFVAQAILAFTGLSCEFPIQVTSSNESSDETCLLERRYFRRRIKVLQTILKENSILSVLFVPFVAN